MAPKKEICRNHSAGSCLYGARCRFLHVTPQQSKPNSFGYGTQNVQQKPNPFGFGMQNSQPRGASDFGTKQNQFKPFENKWNRSSINNNNSSTASQKPDNQTPAPAHKCTDSESCKREIAEDFKNERPMWTLTCYGHFRNGPCDIVGDVSYEELRAAAYDDAKRGLNMQSIVERERNLLQAKLGEFESLARNPYAVRSNPAPSSQNPFMGANLNATVTTQSSGPPLVSSFSQLGALVNTASGISSAAPPSNLFGQPNPFSNLSSGPSSKNPFAPTNSFQNLGERSGFGPNNTTSGNAGTLTSQITPATLQSPFSVSSAQQNPTNSFQNLGERSGFGPNNTTSGNAGTLTSQITPATLQSPFSVSSAQQNAFSTSSAVGQPTVNIQSTNHTQRGSSDGDGSIWMKDGWSIGEIPEEAPPNEYVF